MFLFIREYKYYFSAANETFLMFYVKVYSLFQRTIIDSQCILESFYSFIISDREIDFVETYLATAWKDNSQ